MIAALPDPTMVIDLILSHLCATAFGAFVMLVAVAWMDSRDRRLSQEQQGREAAPQTDEWQWGQ